MGNLADQTKLWKVAVNTDKSVRLSFCPQY